MQKKREGIYSCKTINYKLKTIHKKGEKDLLDRSSTSATIERNGNNSNYSPGTSEPVCHLGTTLPRLNVI